MNERVECFVLNHTDYKDNSILVNVLTKEYGKLSFVVAGAKKITSKNASGILLYTKSEFLFDYKEGKTIFRLKNAKTINYYRRNHEIMEYIAASTLISEASDHLLLQDCDLELQQAIYDLLQEAYQYLDDGQNAKIIVSIFITKLLQLFGSGIEVDGCVLCGNTKVSSFSIIEGGFLCADCANKNHISFISRDVLKAIRYINKAKLNQFEIVENNIDEKDIPLDLFVSFYEMHIGSKLKSFSFYKRLLPLNEHA